MKQKLDDIEKKEMFKVPEGYFEDLPLKIQQRVNEERKPHFSRLPSWSLAMAASVLLLLVFLFLLPESAPSTEELLAEIPEVELIAYLDQIELDEYDLATVMGDETKELELEDTNILEGIDLGDQSIDDVLEEYDLADEYL